MSNKCNKYETLFIFGDEEKLQEHLKVCEECRREHEKHSKISLLIKDVADEYLEHDKKIKMMSAVKKLACCIIVFVGITGFTGYKWYENYSYQLNLEQGSTISDMGLPIDEYGFLSL